MLLRSWQLLVVLLLGLTSPSQSQSERKVGKFEEVFAWKQITFNIAGYMVLQDRFGELDVSNDSRAKRQSNDRVIFQDNTNEPERNWDARPVSSSTTSRPSDQSRNFFIQYNNLPMGVEKVGNRLFITLPRRRYGIPSTLNFIDLTVDSNTRSPSLRPYPNPRASRALTNVYRTRADQCNRLWMVDTGRLEIPNNHQQVQPPAIVVYDLDTDSQILRYQLKDSDLPSNTTSTGLPSITVDIPNGDCANAFAYVPDLATYGLIVYSLKDNDSWRLSHNYFGYNPVAGNLLIRGLRFQWNDGIFSVALSAPSSDGCKTAYFHPMVGTHEFSVSTCVLRNRTASQDSNYWAAYSVVGDRGVDSQSNMHDYHSPSNVIFFADIARDGISCWNAGRPLSPATIAIVAQDSVRMSYPSDLHVTDDDVWVMANNLPTWAYSTLDTNEYNFFVYKASVRDLISGTVCESARSGRFRTRSRDGINNVE